MEQEFEYQNNAPIQDNGTDRYIPQPQPVYQLYEG